MTRRFWSIDVPSAVDHIVSMTKQKPVLIGYSIGAKSIHDMLIHLPATKDKVQGVVTLMRATELANTGVAFKTFLKMSESLVHVFNKYPNLPNHKLVQLIATSVFPKFPSGFYTHLDGTEVEHLVEFFRHGISNRYDKEFLVDLLRFGLYEKNIVNDHGLPIWNVYTENDIFSPQAAAKHVDFVKMRISTYLDQFPDYQRLSDSEKFYRQLSLFRDIQHGHFPPGFAPIYGTNFGKVGHFGPMVGHSKAANVIVDGIKEFVIKPKAAALPATVNINGQNISFKKCARQAYWVMFKGQ